MGFSKLILKLEPETHNTLKAEEVFEHLRIQIVVDIAHFIFDEMVHDINGFSRFVI